MKLELESGRTVDEPTPGALAEALTLLVSDSSGYAILSRDEMTYLQASGDEEIGFVVEYQEGDTDRHFIATNEAVPLATVISMFQSYSLGRDDWRAMCQWKPSNLGRNDERAGCAGSTAASVAIGSVLAAGAVLAM